MLLLVAAPSQFVANQAFPASSEKAKVVGYLPFKFHIKTSAEKNNYLPEKTELTHYTSKENHDKGNTNTFIN